MINFTRSVDQSIGLNAPSWQQFFAKSAKCYLSRLDIVHSGWGQLGSGTVLYVVSSSSVVYGWMSGGSPKYLQTHSSTGSIYTQPNPPPLTDKLADSSSAAAARCIWGGTLAEASSSRGATPLVARLTRQCLGRHRQPRGVYIFKNSPGGVSIFLKMHRHPREGGLYYSRKCEWEGSSLLKSLPEINNRGVL